MMKKLNCKDYNKRITTRDNGNVQFHNKEESKQNSTISANSGGHTLTHDQIMKKGHHIGISPLTKKQVKPKNSSVADHLPIYHHSACMTISVL